jgi:hypothetical protein
MAFFGLLLGGYVAAPQSTLAAASPLVWDSVGDAIFRPIQMAADSTWTGSSAANLTVADLTTLAAAETWTWTSSADIDEAGLGPRARARRPGAGPGRSSTGTPGAGGGRRTPGTPGSGAGRA